MKNSSLKALCVLLTMVFVFCTAVFISAHGEGSEGTTDISDVTDQTEVTEEFTDAPTQPPEVKSVTLSKSALSLYCGETATLDVVIDPSEVSADSIVWSTNNISVLSVDTSGKIFAKETSGSAVITAKVTVQGKVYTPTCSVTVIKPQNVSPSLTSEYCNKNDSVRLYLSIPDNPGITKFRFKISFDTDCLSLVQYGATSKLSGNGTFSVSSGSGSEKVLVWNGRSSVSSKDNLCFLDFKVAADSAKGKTYIKLVADDDQEVYAFNASEKRRVIYPKDDAYIYVTETNATALIYCEGAQAAPGDEIKLNFNISSNPGLSELRISVGYDKREFTPVIAYKGELLINASGSLKMANDTDGGRVVILLSAPENIHLDGTLFTLVLKANDAVSGCDSRVTLSYKSGDYIKNSSGATVKNKLKSGMVEITNSISLIYKKTEKLTPLGGYSDLTWESSDPSVAVADAQGNITTFKKGSTLITATNASGVVVVRTNVEVRYTLFQYIIIYVLFGWIWYMKP